MVQMHDLQGSDPEYFQVSGFAQEKTSGVFHGFFGRNGGVSRDLYASLNCGRGSGDMPEDVVENLRIVSEIAGVPASHLLTLHQIHSAECIEVTAPWELDARPKADAMVTKVPGIALGVLTADCTPVLFHGADGDGAPIVGAAHAGWGGAFGGVLEATVEKMVALGAVADTIEAAIGPCIGPQSYEVGQEFFDRFRDADADNSAFFVSSIKAGHYMFDLPSYCERRLKGAGVANVMRKALDTYFNEEDFFSYRRATHREEADYGRQISVVSILDTKGAG